MYKTIEEKIKNKKIVIVSYVYQDYKNRESYLSGPAQDLAAYLKQRAQTVIFIKQPNPISEDLRPRAEWFENGRLKKNLVFLGLPSWISRIIKKDKSEVSWLHFLFKARDLAAMVYFFILFRRKFDLFVAVESSNCLVGILLKRLGIVKQVVYDVIDYSPQRFKNNFLNRTFHFFDKVCLDFSDFAWVQSERVSDCRQRKWKKIRAVQLVKPTGVEQARIKQADFEKLDRYSIVYAGTLLRRDGVELIFDSLPLIVQRFKEIRIILIGGGGLEEELKNSAREYGLEKNCSFLGLISDAEKVENIISGCAVAAAPYLIEEGSVKFYNDPSKPKLYLSRSVPVVITKMPLFSLEIEKNMAGRAVNYDKEEFAQAVIDILEDDQRLKEYRANALRLISKYTWENIFDKIFNEMYP